MAKLIVLLVCSCLFVAAYGERVTPAPVDCVANEEYLGQGDAPNCDTVCSELGEECTKTYIWAPFGCYCVKGFARDANSKCIPISQCPTKFNPVHVINRRCRINQVWVTRSKTCDRVCAKLGQPCDTNRPLPSGCYCAEGFARNANNVCIPISDCSLTASVI